MSDNIQILTPRYRLRQLTLSDASETYLSWFSQDSSRFITSASNMRDIEDLRTYIESKSEDPDILFLGIFRQSDSQHVGNIKFEPIDRKQKFAILGIFIGDVDSRGTGVGTEVLMACGRWLKENWGIQQLILGVEAANPAALRAYQKVGFTACDTPFLPNADPGVITMRWII